jgi:GTP 3',8-cyclase
MLAVPFMLDAFGRTVDYLRISVTDRCNERCSYCMPADHSDWLPREQILTYEEIITVARVAGRLGVRRIRLTGGEPLVRRGIVSLVERLARLPGIEHLSMTTNGTRLAATAADLRAAGLASLNISLDALDRNLYAAVTRGRLEDVLAGIDAAIAAGFNSLKLNIVLMKGVSENQLWPIVQFAAERGIRAVRFIELMPVSDQEVIGASRFLPIAAAMEILRRHDTLTPLPHAGLGAGPAKYWRLERTGMTVGFIGAMTDEHFCEKCNKVRLTADGFIRPCLGNHGEHDLKPALRQIGTQAAVAEVFARALAEKPLEHIFRDSYVPLRIMTAIGG